MKRCFPDIDVVEAFSILDGKSWPESPLGYGQEHLSTLCSHYTETIDKEKIQKEWELFKNSAQASLPLRSMGAQEVMSTLVASVDLTALFPHPFKLARSSSTFCTNLDSRL